MSTRDEVPAFAWKRRLDQVLEDPGRRRGAGFGAILGLSPMLVRMRQYVRGERQAGREPYIDFFSGPEPGPAMGVPLGGIGGGTITRGWQGGFVRWQLQPGSYQYGEVAADQFSVYVQRWGQRPRLQVLNANKPESGALHGWGWGLDASKAAYHALYPRAWTTYEAPDPDVRLTCRQVSPVFPHNYEESSLPAGVFVWTIENTGSETVTVGLMFSFQNGTGGANDRAGGHHNHLFRQDAPGGEVTGVALRHLHRQPKPLEEDQKLEDRETFEDPLTFAIAAQARPGVEVTYRTRFVTTASGMDLWGDFRDTGKLENVEDERPAGSGLAIGAAVCATVDVPPGESREVAFALAWDMPLARFGGGRAYYRRYTRFYGRDGDAAPAIARDALVNYPEWERQIEAWQQPVLDDEGLPDWYKAALFNELYYLIDGGTVWLDAEEGHDPLPEDDIGRFAYLEGHEYRMYNTYDVHFYASFALASLWPALELNLQRDIARALSVEHPEEQRMLAGGYWAPRKARGMIPHDIGSPTEDPWHRVNAYNIQDTSRWKDLNPKFVLQVYRDYVASEDVGFLKESWGAVREAMEAMMQFDLDEDGLIENEGYPDQTYDMWVVDGPSAYTGGLWLAALGAAAAIADLVGETEQAGRYREMLARGQASYEELLWNGSFYDYDASGSYYSTSIMADQLAGQWYARACGLPSVVPEEHARSALKKVFDTNLKLFEEGELGVVNGMRPDGRVDTMCMQSQEVWAGTTYAVAAAMLQEGLEEEAWETAWGAVNAIYEELGYWFQTPEAWDVQGDYRALGYMRPLAIWAIQWAWERRA